MNNNELAIMRPENMKEIMMAAPQSYELNRQSHDNCVNFGQNILHTIQQQGMNDDLDRQAATFIEKARRTVKAMNERRSPVTKLFDQVRTAFTVIENEIDPAKSGTIGYQLQQLRNQYAAKKRAEEEKRQREEMARRQAEEAARKFRMDVEDDFKQKFQDLVNSTLNKITEVDNNLTLENYDNSLALLRQIKATKRIVSLHGLKRCTPRVLYRWALRWPTWKRKSSRNYASSSATSTYPKWAIRWTTP